MPRMKKNSNQQTIIEKIEILDESTGQIILKHRARTVEAENNSSSNNNNTNSNQLSKSDDEDDSNEFEGDSDEHEMCTVTYPHPTIISRANMSHLVPIEVSSPDGKGSLYRCPLCPLQSAYYNQQASKVIDHMQGNKHFGIAVKHRGWTICKCDDPTCENNATLNTDASGQKSKSHRHCPHCGRLSVRRNDFVVHIGRCCPSNLQPSSASTNPTSIPAQQQKENKKNNALHGKTVKQALLHQQQLQQQQQQQQQQQIDIAEDVVNIVTTNSSVGAANNTQQTYIYVISSPQQQGAGIDNSQLYTTLPLKRKLDENELDDQELTNKIRKSMNFDDPSNKITIEYIDDISSQSSSSLNIAQSGAVGQASTIILPKDHLQPSTSSNVSANHQANTSGLSAHIVQNYSILAQEITAPLDNELEMKAWHPKPLAYQANKNANASRAQKDLATCQFCGRAMLKKNIPTHIRRAHTPKEELVCINEEQNIFTLQHLKPGQRRKRSARAYDYSLMTATISIDEDPCEGIENKFITEGEEILSTDLLQLADRIKFGISQIPTSTLTKLIEILNKIEFSTTDEICSNAKTIKNMIALYLTSSEEYKYKIKQIGNDIVDRKKQVNSLRGDLKEVMTRKAQLERRIQPIICELQKLEDQHGSLIDSIMQLNGLIHLEIIHGDEENEDDEDDDESQIVC